MKAPNVIQELSDCWQSIAREAAALPRDILPIERGTRTHAEVMAEMLAGGQPGWISSWGDAAKNWLVYPIMFGDELPLGDVGMPHTTALLRGIGGVKVAALSLFKPHTLLPVHSHPELAVEGLQTYHLGLDVPDHCYLWTDGSLSLHRSATTIAEGTSADGRFWLEGNGIGLTWDGSQPHYAFNASDHDRVILYLEYRP